MKKVFCGLEKLRSFAPLDGRGRLSPLVLLCAIAHASAPLARQLYPQHLTEGFIEVLNLTGQKNLPRRFPQTEKFCASMPD
jgi:hypothetical protein